MSRRHPQAEPAVCFDFDGTLTVGPWPDGLAPNEPMIALTQRLARVGADIIVQTGRPPEDRALVEGWLTEQKVPFREVALGKPRADLYVDDYGLIHSPRVIEALLAMLQRDPDDWRRALAGNMLIDGYQREVAATAENPSRDRPGDEGFQVVIPFTSGMDSLTLWLQARDEGLPYRLVYFDYGQPYADAEVDCCDRLLAAVGEDDDRFTVVQYGVAFVEWNHILCGRNAILLHDAAEMIDTWGEVHFGGLGGETPVRGGDKSRRFLADTQALLALSGKDVRLVTPLGTMDKPDIVAWLLRRGYAHLLAESKSCFNPDVHQCGACVPCFRKWAALEANGLDADSFFPDGTSFGEVCARYRQRLDSGDGGYSGQRRADIVRAISAWERVADARV